MKKILLHILFFTGLISGLNAQEEAVFTQYHISPILINPAAAGFSEEHQFQVNARGSWTGFVDAPQNIAGIYNGPVGNSFGFGLAVMSESAAQINRLRARMNFALRFPLNDKIKLAAGVGAEYQQMNLGSEFTLNNFFQAGDRVLEEAMNGRGDFDAALSVYGTHNKRTFAGLVFTDLVESRLDDIVTTSSSSSLLRHFIFHVGHEFEIYDLNFTLTPSLMVRQIKDAPNQVDVNLKAGFIDDQLIAGLSYRSFGGMGILMGTKLSNFYLYYTYDMSFQQFQEYNSGSHEIMVAFSFKKKKVVKTEGGVKINSNQ